MCNAGFAWEFNRGLVKAAINRAVCLQVSIKRGSTVLCTNLSFPRLDVGYIDLYLIHSPVPGANIDSYKAMLKLKEQGLLR